MGLVLSSCGKKDSDSETADAATQGDPTTGLSAGNMNISTLPNLALAMKSSAAALAENEADWLDLTGVVGTPLKMADLASTGTYSGNCKNWDRYFFGCAISAVNTAGTATQAQKSAIQRGEAVCRNIAETANILRSFGGGSMCYMSKVPKLSTASVVVSKEGGGITASSYADMMKPIATGSKLIKVTPKSSKGAGQDIFIGIPKATGSSLEFTLSYCKEGQATGQESILVDLSNGKLITKNIAKYSESKNGTTFESLNSESSTLYILKDGEGVKFDLTKDRTIEQAFKQTGSWGSSIGKSIVSMDKDGYLTNKNNSSQSWTYGGQTHTGTQKIFAKTQVTGASGFVLAVPQMGMSMKFTQGSNSFNPSGAVEWQTDTFADTSTSDLYTTAKAYDFSDAIFSATLAAPDISFAADHCTRTPDAEVSFDMTTTESAVVQKECEGDDKLREMYETCNVDAIKTAREKTFN